MRPPVKRRAEPPGAAVWLGLVGAVLLLAFGGWATLSAALDQSDAPVAQAAAPRRAAGGVIVASSGGFADAPRRGPAAPEPAPPTPTASGWFATATAGQGALAAADELAARSIAPGPAAASVAQGRPPALPAASARAPFPVAAAPARPQMAPPQPTAETPPLQQRAVPPPVDLAAVRATAQAAIHGGRAIPTPGPAAPSAGRVPDPALEVDRQPPSAQQRVLAQPAPAAPSSPGYNTVLTRIAVAAAARPTATPGAYRRREPAWTPSPTGPTPTLAPTRTPRPRTPVAQATRSPFTPPPLRNGDNKWGVGVYRTSNNVLDTIRETQPGVVLLMDPDEGWARKVREAAPNAFIVGRRFRREDDQPLDNPSARGEDMADWVAEIAVPLKGVVDAWMSYNEVVGHNAFEEYKRYDQFQLAFARRLQDVHGVAAVANNDGSGAVEPEDYPKYFAESIRASQYFGLHAYSPPATDRMPIEADWNALRYRKIHAELEKAGIRGKQMVITESGLGDGFRPGVATDDEMSEDFVWFTRELQRDAYVIGHAAFGLFDATGAWDRFELTGTLVPGMVRRMLSSR
jgi:hypothetical protein